jgi:ketosteroid isomerase-like protein
MNHLKTLAHVLVLLPLLLGGLARASDEKKGAGFECPKVSRKASAAEVFEARLAALNAGNLELAFCYYAEDAVVVMPGSVVQGREAIKAAFVQFGSLFGGVLPTPSSVTVGGDVVLATFSLAMPGVSIPDGADTFVIRDGLIQAQTVHASIVFSAP